MDKLKQLSAITELIPHSSYAGPTGKLFTWIENQLILLLVSTWLIAAGLLFILIQVAKWVTDLFVKGIMKLNTLLQKRNVLHAHFAEEQDPTHLDLPNINLN